jgi:hypothetical protein
VQKIVLFLDQYKFLYPAEKVRLFPGKIDFAAFFRLKAFFLVQFFIPGGDVNP